MNDDVGVKYIEIIISMKLFCKKSYRYTTTYYTETINI